jgi:hypothetical protein
MGLLVLVLVEALPPRISSWWQRPPKTPKERTKRESRIDSTHRWFHWQELPTPVEQEKKNFFVE